MTRPYCVGLATVTAGAHEAPGDDSDVNHTVPEPRHQATCTRLPRAMLDTTFAPARTINPSVN